MAHNGEGSVLAVAVALAVVCVLAVGLRFHVRRARALGYGLDDWLCLPALVLTIICCSLIAAGSAHSKAAEQVQNDPNFQFDPNVVELQKLSFAFIVLQPLALGLTKASVLFLYRRVFCGKVFEIASWALISTVGAWALALFLASVLQCGGNISKFWTTVAGSTTCAALPTSGAFIASDVALDFMIMAMPVPFVMGLQMPLKKRLLAIAIFIIGNLSVAVAIPRLAFFAKTHPHPPSLPAQIWGVTMIDTSGFNSIALFCPVIEIGIALIAACAPALQASFSNSGHEASRDPELAFQDLMDRHKRGESADALAAALTNPTWHPPSSRRGLDDGKESGDTQLSLREILA